MWPQLRRWLKRSQVIPLGLRGERAAARFLRRRGYQIISLGQRLPSGELDIVAVDGQTVVFVEVKTRCRVDNGHPADAVDGEKQRRITDLALRFLQRHELLECSSRFDVVAVTWPVDARRPLIEHFPDAFEAVGKGQMYS